MDLGLAIKIRPCLGVSVVPDEDARAIVTLVPHTTSLRSTPFEADVATVFLKPGAFDARRLVTAPAAWLIRKVGILSAEQMAVVEAARCRWLGLRVNP